MMTLTDAATYEERLQNFFEMYGDDRDPADSLAVLPGHLHALAAPIVGEYHAERIAAAMVAGLLRTDVEPSEWREVLEANRSHIFSECLAGPVLRDLYAYARYGIALTSLADFQERRSYLRHLVERACAIRAAIPDTMLADDNDLDDVLDTACGRWALDNDLPLTPSQFARLAGISEGRVRNMMSGARLIPSRDGKIAAADARVHLATREGFLSSIWQDRVAPSYESPERQPIAHPVFVPIARDGTTFHPGLSRAGQFTVGAKGNELRFPDFEMALTALQTMAVPYWRRPNSSGTWGIVAGVRWARLDAGDLEAIAQDPSHRIPEST